LDGLDEIPYEYRDTVFNHLRELINQTPDLALVMTSRITPYIPYFPAVNIVELADFSGADIQDYVQRRFQTPAGQLTPSSKDNKAETFLELLRRPEHKLIRNMARTPILLELICCTFQERLQFPQRAIKLYQEGLEILLQRSQYTQHSQADIFYRDLPLSEKFKLLNILATAMFQKGHFYVEKSGIITIIYQYLQTELGDQLDGEDLFLKSENILRAIQLQYGLLVEQAKNIFSFSHLTFQEYLTARHLVNSLTSANQTAQLRAIAEQVNNPRWLEVIRLILALLPTGDRRTSE
jgi:predicted NACHT family NTPase